MRRHAVSIALLAVVVLDALWIAANPPAERTVNPFFLYLVFFGGVCFVLSMAAVPLTKRLVSLVGGFSTFAIVAVVLSVAEEVIAYVTGSGLYQDGKHALGPGLVHASLPLFTWTVGIYAVTRLFMYRRLELFVLAGLSGWMCETVIGGLFFKQPLLALAALPAIAFSYVVLAYLPVRAIEDSSGGRRASWWRVPTAVLIPAVMWSLGGIAGVLLVKGQ